MEITNHDPHDTDIQLVEKIMTRIITLLTITISLLVFAESDSKKIAVVKMLRGDVQLVGLDGVTKKLAKGDWVNEGSIIKTQARSFCKISFIDKSSMNIGPKSELKIEKFSKSEPGIINVISGKIRSKVTKDYLKMDKDKSKVFIKSKSAVMGVRGTEYMFAANAKTGSATAVLFEGEVVFNRLEARTDNSDLEAIVSNGRKIKPGQYSIVTNKYDRPTVPAKMNKLQFKALNKNTSFDSATTSASTTTKTTTTRSVVPPGLSGVVVSGDADGLSQNSPIASSLKLKTDGAKRIDTEKFEQSKGYIDGADVRPADGTIVHIESGTIISPGSDSKFDKNTGEWVSSSIGTVDKAGGYVPPEGYKMTEDGELLKVDNVSGQVKKVLLEVKPVDQLPPLDRIPVIEFKGDTKDQVRPDTKKINTTNNPINVNCDSGNCLPPPPVCEGCGIIPPTYLNGAPSDSSRPTNRPKTPVRINVNKN